MLTLFLPTSILFFFPRLLKVHCLKRRRSPWSLSPAPLWRRPRRVAWRFCSGTDSTSAHLSCSTTLLGWPKMKGVLNDPTDHLPGKPSDIIRSYLLSPFILMLDSAFVARPGHLRSAIRARPELQLGFSRHPYPSHPESRNRRGGGIAASPRSGSRGTVGPPPTY